MPGPPRRKRFQIHLSTAIVMTFVAGALIWANVGPYELPLMDRWRLGPRTLRLYGWPLCVNRYSISSMMGSDTAQYHGLSEERIAVNVVVAIAILFATWFICEWLIRRRAARKDS